VRSPRNGRARAEVVALPAPGHLSEGVVVEGLVLARVFGINLLRVTADVVLMPAAVRPAHGIDLERTRRLARISVAGRRNPARALSPPTDDGRPRLHDALQLLRDTDALLEDAGRSM